MEHTRRVENVDDDGIEEDALKLALPDDSDDEAEEAEEETEERGK